MTSAILARSAVKASLRPFVGVRALTGYAAAVGSRPSQRLAHRLSEPPSDNATVDRRSSDESEKGVRGQWHAATAALVATAAAIQALAPCRAASPRCDSGGGDPCAGPEAAKAGASLRQWYAADSAGGADESPSKTADPKYVELIHAIRADSVRRSFILLRDLRAGIDAPITDSRETALAVACKTGSMQVLSALLRYGADPSAADAQGATCVALACSEGQLEVVRMLAQGARADLDSPDACGEHPVHRAVTCGHLDVVHYLLSTKGGRGRQNALTTEAAAEAGAPESRLETPLHTALRRLSRPPKSRGVKPRRYEMMELLLDFGADPTLQDRYGDTPLHLCAQQHDLQGVWMLLAEVPDVGVAAQIVNSDGLTFLQEAEALGWRSELLVGVARVMPRSVRRWAASLIFNEILLVATT